MISLISDSQRPKCNPRIQLRSLSILSRSSPGPNETASRPKKYHLTICLICKSSPHASQPVQYVYSEKYCDIRQILTRDKTRDNSRRKVELLITTQSDMFILPTGSSKPACLTSETVLIMESGNVKCHY